MKDLTPLFFVEVLGDLEKENVTNDQARTFLVKSFAAKTSIFRSYANLPQPLAKTPT
jgi:hypothetical protein